MSGQKLREAWQEPRHADLFDARAHYSLERLRRVYEKFNEFCLFLDIHLFAPCITQIGIDDSCHASLNF